MCLIYVKSFSSISYRSEWPLSVLSRRQTKPRIVSLVIIPNIQRFLLNNSKTASSRERRKRRPSEKSQPLELDAGCMKQIEQVSGGGRVWGWIHTPTRSNTSSRNDLQTLIHIHDDGSSAWHSPYSMAYFPLRSALLPTGGRFFLLLFIFFLFQTKPTRLFLSVFAFHFPL